MLVQHDINVVIDDGVLTSNGSVVSYEAAIALLAKLTSDEFAAEVANDLQFKRVANSASFSFEDIAMMRETVEERGCHLGVTEDARPFAKGQISCDDDRGALIELAHEMEEQLPARCYASKTSLPFSRGKMKSRNACSFLGTMWLSE